MKQHRILLKQEEINIIKNNKNTNNKKEEENFNISSQIENLKNRRS